MIARPVMRVPSERFEVEQVVGSGSMGTVYRALDRDGGGHVALKIVRAAVHEARFEREIDVLARLRHPHIVRYVGHGLTTLGERFLAIEWVEGETVSARLGRRGLPLDDALLLCTGIADGLAAAHQQGVVHRDVKPNNLLLPGGALADVKLIDFGIARIPGADESLSRTGEVLGTPSSMAPEQASQADEVGPPADVYALGCVLHECVTGRIPSARIGVRALRPDAPPAIVHLLERLLARDPGGRPAHAGVVLAELRRLRRAGLPPLPAPGAVPVTPLGGVSLQALRNFDSGAAEAGLGAVARELLAVLARHVPLPLAVLRAGCARLGRDPSGLNAADVAALAPALAEAVARFTHPGARATVLAELAAVVAPIA